MSGPYLAPTADLPRLARVYHALDRIAGEAPAPWADQADRIIADDMERRWPGLRRMMRHARGFHAAIAAAEAERGVPGIIFAAAGLPASLAPHRTARTAGPDTRYVYADPGPDVTLINRAEYQDDPAVTAVAISVRTPDALLGAPEVQALGEPLSLQIHLAAHFWPDETARSLVARYALLLPPGSSLVLTLGAPGQSPAGREFAACLSRVAGTRMYAHSPAAVTAWLGDAGMVTRGAADVRLWDRREWGERLPEPASGTAIAAVGRKRG